MTDQTTDKFAYHRYVGLIAEEDVRLVLEKDRSYGSSWKKRGGAGAFMMLARKWDRLEEMMENPTNHGQYDLFGRIEDEQPFFLPDGVAKDGTALAEVRDLRRYLLLVEAEMIERGVVAPPSVSECFEADIKPGVADIRPGVLEKAPYEYDPDLIPQPQPSQGTTAVPLTEENHHAERRAQIDGCTTEEEAEELARRKFYDGGFVPPRKHRIG